MNNFPCYGNQNYITLRGLNFSYQKYENPSKPVIIMLHGFMDFSHSFDLLAKNLKDHYEIYAWDARGFGNTEWVHKSGYYYFSEYIYDLSLFLDFIGKEQYILLGHSMGGIIASLYAGTYPEKVTKLINLEGWFFRNPNPEEAPEKMRTWIEQLKSLNENSNMKNLEDAAKRLMKNDPLLVKEIAYHLAYHGTKEIDGYYYWKHDPTHKTISPTLTNLDQIKAFIKNIVCPILLLKGSEKHNFLGSSNFINGESFFEKAKIYEIENSGHNLHLHQPEKIAQIITEFLK
ncbi:MAG: alpha/beta hydrolase [Candidatus Sericytochromatia bacterium]